VQAIVFLVGNTHIASLLQQALETIIPKYSQNEGQLGLDLTVLYYNEYLTKSVRDVFKKY
jgi:hypothetical protein